MRMFSRIADFNDAPVMERPAVMSWSYSLTVVTVSTTADPAFDQLSASTLVDLKDDVVYDNFFVSETTLRMLRMGGALDPYAGGTAMVTPFVYDRVDGGAIAPGSDVTVVQKNILAATAFVPKEYVEKVPLNLWQANVINAGPAGKVKLVDLYMTNAVQAANTDLGIDLFRHGQNLAAQNRFIYVNGFTEAFNDGINPSWDGNVFTTYGGQLRNGVVGNTINSVPIWLGAQSGATGQISYKPLVEAYMNCVRPPEVGVCNKALFSYLLERQEVKQRLYEVVADTTLGPGSSPEVAIKVLGAKIYMDKLAPSTKYGQLLPSGLSQTTSIQPAAFTTPTYSGSQNSISNFPSNTSVTPGEVFFWIRTDTWKVRPTEDPEYNFNFTPWIRSQMNPDLVVGFFKLGINLYCVSPRDNSQLFGAGF